MVLDKRRFVRFVWLAQWNNRYHRLSSIPRARPDSILGLLEEFNQDQHPMKIDLTAGVYMDNSGKNSPLTAVNQAQLLLEQSGANKSLSYLPITGCPSFTNNVLKFLYTESAPNGKKFLDSDSISCIQTLGGTGALTLASVFLSSFVSDTLWLPQLTWANHCNVFSHNGFSDIRYYTYYEDGEVNVDGWCDQLRAVLTSKSARSDSPHSIVLHACCHNPTGMDPTIEQWSMIIPLINELGMVPIIDMAYQGLDSGNPDKDAYLLRLCLEYEWPNGLYLCQSFAKNMGLYSARVGSLSIVHPIRFPESKTQVDSQLKRIVRSLYSSPPRYGSMIATTILTNKNLKQQWYMDVKAIRDRLWLVRNTLHERLNWPRLIDKNTQHGMFYYSGLSPKQVNTLRKECSVYVTEDGRISLSGINSRNVDYVCEALLAVTAYNGN
ncbi:HBL037Wp [Eremothecium sinecaudum]|uniref:HBL037Wp n=1 Tax=Eremothecium sinecaudum TaxID=45286 RepID=A0A125RDX8_9SACH|nr:HBL037Wp [Eremothecium sinecaudum]AMD18865.1 HBL037Wp [Eremothecium sinecaudum]